MLHTVNLGVSRIVTIVRGSVPVIAALTIYPLLYRVSSFFLILLPFIGPRGRRGSAIIRGCRHGVEKRDSGKRDFSCFSLKLMMGDCTPFHLVKMKIWGLSLLMQARSIICQHLPYNATSTAAIISTPTNYTTLDRATTITNPTAFTSSTVITWNNLWDLYVGPVSTALISTTMEATQIPTAELIPYGSPIAILQTINTTCIGKARRFCSKEACR